MSKINAKKINAKKIEAKLTSAEGEYRFAIGSIERQISDFIDFEFSILWQESDGFVLLDALSDDSTVSPLSDCLEVIQNGTILTRKIHRTLSI